MPKDTPARPSSISGVSLEPAARAASVVGRAGGVARTDRTRGPVPNRDESNRLAAELGIDTI